MLMAHPAWAAWAAWICNTSGRRSAGWRSRAGRRTAGLDGRCRKPRFRGAFCFLHKRQYSVTALTARLIGACTSRIPVFSATSANATSS